MAGNDVGLAKLLVDSTVGYDGRGGVGPADTNEDNGAVNTMGGMRGVPVTDLGVLSGAAWEVDADRGGRPGNLMLANGTMTSQCEKSSTVRRVGHLLVLSEPVDCSDRSSRYVQVERRCSNRNVDVRRDGNAAKAKNGPDSICHSGQ